MIYFKVPKKQHFADLHLHTTASDGEFSPSEVLIKCKENRIHKVAITDHDSVDGIQEAKATGEKLGVDVISGIEMSMQMDGQELHLLGYFLDETDERLKEYLIKMNSGRIVRAERMVEKLNDLGFNLKMDSVLEKADKGTVGRPHIAKAMLDAGIVKSYQAAFNRWIGDGQPACEDKKLSTPDVLIKLIHSCGGIAILAHPGVQFPREKIVALKRNGLDGIEIVHPRHTSRAQSYLHNLAFETGLLYSGGSDFHTDRGKKNTLGKYVIEISQVEKLQNYAEGKYNGYN